MNWVEKPSAIPYSGLEECYPRKPGNLPGNKWAYSHWKQGTMVWLTQGQKSHKLLWCKKHNRKTDGSALLCSVVRLVVVNRNCFSTRLTACRRVQQDGNTKDKDSTTARFFCALKTVGRFDWSWARERNTTSTPQHMHLQLSSSLITLHPRMW